MPQSRLSCSMSQPLAWPSSLSLSIVQERHWKSPPGSVSKHAITGLDENILAQKQIVPKFILTTFLVT